MSQTEPAAAAKSDPIDALWPAQRAALLGFMIPLASVLLTLKALRVMAHPEALGALQWLDLYLSDVTLTLGMASSGLALTASRAYPRAALLTLQLVYLFWLYLEMAAHNFFMVTGSTLDWQLVSVYFQYPGDLWGMVNLSTEWHIKAMFVFLTAVFGALPWYLLRRLGRRETTPSRFNSARRFALIGAALIAASFLFPIASSERRLGHDAVVELVWSGVEQHVLRKDATHAPLTAEAARQLHPLPGATHPNIVLVVLESTGWNATSLGDPKLATTPNLQRFSTDALVFEQAHAVIPHTSKALFTIHCGSAPDTVFAITEARSNGFPQRCLPELLAEQGYDTAFFQAATMFFEHRHSLVNNLGYGYKIGADDLTKEGFEQTHYFGYEERSLLQPSRNWLKSQNKDKPFLLAFLTLSSHHNYNVPDAFLGKFADDEEHNKYLSSVSYVDTFLGELLAMLKEEGHGEDTLIVIVGDHGEAFGEHGRYQHDNVIYQEGLHIPMLIAGPGVAPARVSAPTSQLDLLPTLVHYAGFELEGSYQGLDLSVEENRTTRRKHYAYCWYDRRCAATLDFPLKLVHHFDERPDQLFDLQHDPLEQHDLIESNAVPQGLDLEAMRADLLRWVSEAHARHMTSGR